jgi:TRAP-type C4-dicarboxylate transport system permease small subunit
MNVILVVSRIVNRIVETSVFVMLAVMVAVVSASVFWRYGLNAALSWSEELVRYLLVWISFLGASMATYRGAHIGIAAFTDRLPERAQQAVALGVNSLIVLFLGIVLYQGVKILPVMAVRLAPTLGIRMQIFYTVLPISAAVMILHVVAESVTLLFDRGKSS